MVAKASRPALRSFPGGAPVPALLEPPLTHPGVVARREHGRHAVAAPSRRAGVVRILGRAPQGGAEDSSTALSLVSERAGELAQNRVADHHRRQLTSGEHVGADGDHVGGQVLVDALVEALVAATEQRQLVLLRELRRQSVVEGAPAGGERHHATPAAPLHGIGAPAPRQGRLDHVDPHRPFRPHPRRACRPPAPPRRGVVARRSIASSSWPSARAFTTWRCSRNQSNQPGKRVKTSTFTARDRGTRGSPRCDPPQASTEVTASEMRGTRAPSSSSSTSQDGPGTTFTTLPRPSIRQPTRSPASHSPSPRGASSAGTIRSSPAI